MAPPVPLVIIGAGGLARETAWLVREINQQSPSFNLLGCIAPEHQPVVIGTDEWAWNHLSADTRFCVAIGNPGLREKIAAAYESRGFRPAALVHPSVKPDTSVHIGEGTIIAKGTILTVDIHIGAHCLIDIGCTISHDTRLEDFVTLHPGVTATGNVHLGKGVEVGAGTVFRNQVQVAAGIRTGAGAVVVSDLVEKGTYAGVPARLLSGA